MKSIARKIVAIALSATCAVGTLAQTIDPAVQNEFQAAAGSFSACLTMTVRMGMTTKMDPATFKEGLAKSCKTEEARFRPAAIKVAVASGRTEAQAAAEVDGNIANSRRIYAADQEKYVTTGVVPR